MPRAEVDYDRGRVVLETSWAEKDLARQVPGMNWDGREKVWHAPLSWGTCVTLRGVFGDRLEVGPLLRQWAADARAQWIDYGLLLRESTAADLYDAAGEKWNPDPRLYPPQQTGVAFLALPDGGVLLADQMGVGKTPQALVALRALPDTLPGLVICPNSVKGHWANEVPTWFPEAHPYVVNGGAQSRRKVLLEASEDPQALVLIHFDVLRLHSRLAAYGSIRLSRCQECGGHDERITPTRCEVHPKELNHLDFRTVIVDEAHRMKDSKAKQTRAAWAVLHQPSITRRWALTGTPIANNVGDLWSIMHGIAPADYPTRSAFIDRFALLAWNRYAALDIVGVRPDTAEEFHKILDPRMRRMLKAVVLPFLPPKVREVREAPMATKQARAYRAMEEHLLAELDDGDVVLATTNLVKALRLVQFSSSYCEVDPETNQLRLSEPSPKLDVLEEVLQELGPDRQVAVCAASRQLIEMAAARFNAKGVSYRLLTGKVPQHERQQNLNEFQAGDAQVMLFTIAAGGVGVNMSAADTIVFLQRSWSMLENVQAEDRVHRVGSERHESVTVVDIIAPDTIEVRQLQKLREKATRLEEIVRDRDRLAKAGYSTAELDHEEQQLLAGHLLGG
jgi:SNF2 family DNA or RNA helicase